MNYELQVNALCLSLFLSLLFSLSVSRVFCRVLQAKSEFNAEVNQSHEAYVVVYELAVAFVDKTF